MDVAWSRLLCRIRSRNALARLIPSGTGRWSARLSCIAFAGAATQCRQIIGESSLSKVF